MSVAQGVVQAQVLAQDLVLAPEIQDHQDLPALVQAQP
jgi:hypothetical protein